MNTMTHSESVATAGMLTINQIAERLGCSRVHVYRLIQSGALKAMDISVPGSQRTKMRIRVEDFNEYIHIASLH